MSDTRTCPLPEWAHPATLAVRAGQERTGFQETSEALFLTQGFVYDSAEEARQAFIDSDSRYTYSRYDNPTVHMFEERLRQLEGAEAASATATGMAAVFASLASVVSQDSRIVAARALFGSSIVVMDDILGRWGVTTDYVDAHDLDQWREALSRPADVVFFETPSNPMQDLVDVEAVSALAHQAGAIVVVDNVFATPVLQRPLELGADVVVYSATKHIDGQGRVLGGAVLGSKDYVQGPLRTFLRNTGPTLNPFAAWVLLKGLETMPLRVQAQCERALTIARALEADPHIARVYYPYLESHPQHDLALRQQTAGGTVVTFDVAAPADASSEEATARTFRFLDALRIVDLSNNLGDAKSLATHPATTTHSRIGSAGRAQVGIGDTTVRLSVGLEDAGDLVRDLTEALRA